MAMNKDQRYLVGSYVDAMFIDDQFIVLFTDQIFQLSAVAGVIIATCEGGGASLAEICDALVETFGDPGDVAAMTLPLLDDLLSRRILSYEDPDLHPAKAASPTPAGTSSPETPAHG